MNWKGRHIKTGSKVFSFVTQLIHQKIETIMVWLHSTCLLYDPLFEKERKE